MTGIQSYELCAEHLEDFIHLNISSGTTVCIVDFDLDTEWRSLDLKVGSCVKLKEGVRDPRQ